MVDEEEVLVNKKILVIGFVILLVLLTPVFYDFLTRIESGNFSEEERLKQLSSLPYTTWTEVSEEDAGKKGVLEYDLSKAFDGVNVYCSEASSTVKFLNMSGGVLHSVSVGDGVDYRCKLVEFYDEDEFLFLDQDNGTLLRVGLDESISFSNDEHWFHHDLDVAENGDVYALSLEVRDVPSINPSEPIGDDYVVVLSPNGVVKRKVSFADMVVKNEVFLEQARNSWCREELDVCDVFHTNSLEIIDRSVDYGNGRGFEKGQVLFCMLRLNLIGVADLEKEEIVWAWGSGELSNPHHPVLLDNGNILFFDNGPLRGYSRVVELNPVTGERVWEYAGSPPESFFSPLRGGVQKLPNENILITESDKGHVFEITSDGEVVWDYWNPLFNNEGDRGAIYRMMRLTPSEWSGLDVVD